MPDITLLLFFYPSTGTHFYYLSRRPSDVHCATRYERRFFDLSCHPTDSIRLTLSVHVTACYCPPNHDRTQNAVLTFPRVTGRSLLSAPPTPIVDSSSFWDNNSNIGPTTINTPSQVVHIYHTFVILSI
jgi:hypothetical protein